MGFSRQEMGKIIAMIFANIYGGTSDKNLHANAGDIREAVLISGSGRSPGAGHGNPIQYSCQRIPWTEQPGKPQYIGMLRIRQD